MMKLVHIDLKGAPFLPAPQGAFWESFCSLISKWGVSGLLIEWEDSVRLPSIDNDMGMFVYTRKEVNWLVDTAKRNNLEVIPLVQTFGHLEYVLKSAKRKSVREVPDLPNCLLPIEPGQHDESLKLVKSLIDEVLALTPHCPAVHLGGDEVWHLGTGPRSQTRLRENPGLDRDQIFIDHMTTIVDYVRSNYPEKRILIWDDMLRNIPFETLKSADRLISKAEPVIWNYSPQPGVLLDDRLWSKYQLLFQSVWIASAFKGASSSCAQVPPISHHVSNHLGWLDLLESKSHLMPKNVAGWILTGWQRFDHFASLCELLPVGIPSLCCCLAALQTRKFGPNEVQTCSIELGLDLGAEINNQAFQEASPLVTKFPGAELYLTVGRFVSARAAYKNYVESDTFVTWFSDHYLNSGRFSPLQLGCIQTNVQSLLNQFRELAVTLENILPTIYPSQVCHEWMNTYMKPILDDLNGKNGKISILLG